MNGMLPEEWDQLRDIYSRAVLSDTPGRPTVKWGMRNEVEKPMKGYDVRGGRMPQASQVPPRRQGMLSVEFGQDDPFHYYHKRNVLPADSPLHAVYGPLEHGQFTEETVQGNPFMALPLAVATPAYTAGKAVGLIDARSPASLDEILEAYKGIGRGLFSRRPR
jgi:hypothetical protein